MAYKRKPYTGTRTKFKGPTRATIQKSKTKGYYDLITPYNEEFKDSLKATFQYPYRLWDNDEKVWKVRESVLSEVAELLKLYYDEVFVVEDIPESAPQLGNSIFSELFQTLKGLPNGNIDKVYSALANAVHPDKGGNNNLMTALNKARDEAKK